MKKHWYVRFDGAWRGVVYFGLMPEKEANDMYDQLRDAIEHFPASQWTIEQMSSNDSTALSKMFCSDEWMSHVVTKEGLKAQVTTYHEPPTNH